MENISTHALREEGDSNRALELRAEKDFYPRPPRGGRLFALLATCPSHYFYPRPPRGGRHLQTLLTLVKYSFLPTPSARRATSATGKSLYISRFLPTPSARRATLCLLRHLHQRLISTHALREEGDPRTNESIIKLTDFYPRPPRGGRRNGAIKAMYSADFYPRPPRGGRLSRQLPANTRIPISTHALREEGDESL